VWNELARRDLHFSILDDPGVRDPATRDGAFATAGEEDAWRLAWFVDPTMRVVDLGCGIGRVMRPLAAHCREVIGVDVSEAMLEEARAYLDGVANARFLANDGKTLAGIEPGSVGFLYSLLCLIHVDRRSCYRYLQEIRRVLAPGGMAFLQFQDILTDRGLEKFLAVLDLDYPLELYTPEEVRRFVRSVGLDVLHVQSANEYLYVMALQGSASEWIAARRDGIAAAVLERSGVFRGDSSGGWQGTLVARLTSRLADFVTLRASVRITLSSEKEPSRTTDVLVPLPPRGASELALECRADGSVQAFLDGARLEGVRRSSNPGSQATAYLLEVGLFPAGFEWNERTLELFPHLAMSIQVASVESTA
jgi:ubiquinone/menaquinone biosynthesis C-methylase UbiE